MTKLLSKTAVVALSAIVASPCLLAQTIWDGSADTEWEGDGSPGNPYLISSAAELAGLAKRTNANETFEGKYFRLTADLWLSDDTMAADERPLWIPIGEYSLNNDDSEQNPGGFYGKEAWFKGVFDGDGHTIHNLWYNGTTDFEDWNDPFGSGQLDFSAWYKALFGLLDGATIKNVRLVDANIGGTALIGGYCIRALNSTFDNIYISGAIKSASIEAGGSAAAVAVEATDCVFTNCEVNAKVYAKSATGGLIGHLKGASTVDNCTVGGTVTGCINLGGFVGVTSSAESDASVGPVITNSSSSAEVTVIAGRNQGNGAGGFIGINNGVISRCHTTGDVHVTTGYGAGFCDNNRGIIQSCYATGDVYNEEYGVSLAGFVFDNGYSLAYDEKAKGIVENCFYTGKIHAPAPPSDVIAQPTRIYGFAAGNPIESGSRLVNCYYDKTATPDISFFTFVGEFGVTTEKLQSKEFVDSLNYMAAITDTYLWQYNSGAFPTYTDTKADGVAPFFKGGDGSESSPYEISNKQELENLAYATNHGWDFSGQYIRQTADIALNAPMEQWGEQMPRPWTPIGYFKKDCSTAAYFRGTYDGSLHTIANLYIDDIENNYLGLFGVLGDGVHICNLGVTNAWVNGMYTAGIVAGASKIHNDPNRGLRRLSRVWTSGQVAATTCASILGTSPSVGQMVLTACSSTADITKKGSLSSYAYLFVDNDLVSDPEIRYYGCWFGGKLPATVPISNTGFVHSYVDGTKNAVPAGSPTTELLSTAYMQTKDFINDINYAAAIDGIEAGWGYIKDSYPAFGGEQPAITVTVCNGVDPDFSFKAFEGTTMSPLVPVTKDGSILSGWYTDDAGTQLFRFGTDKFSENTTLFAKWSDKIVPDYEIFKNKFATTFNITTAAQLYGLSDIVNGVAPGIERNDFTGKTIRLANDIVLNDPAGYDEWGKSVTPMRFMAIGDYYTLGHCPFNGKFDGNGHAIIGLYTSTKSIYENSEYRSPGGGLFDEIGPKGEVTDLYIRKALAEGQGGILAASSEGKITRCGVDGRIIIGQPEGAGGDYAAGLVGEIKEGGSVSECYAEVDITAYEKKGAYGLVAFAYGDITDSYAVGKVKFVSGFGRYAGIVCGATKQLTNCYAAISLDWNYTGGILDGTGGAYKSANTTSAYYDRSLLANDPFGGYEEVYARGIALDSDEMRRMASFGGWDFESVWGRRNDLNDGYPYLRWTAPGLENDPDETAIPATGLKLDITEYTGKAGTTLLLKATVEPENATDNALTWSSSNPDVASVDNDGLVSLLTVGTATITVHCGDLSASCELTVEAQSGGIGNVVIDEDTEVSIITLQGIRVYTGPFAGHHLAPGIYIVRLANGSSSKIIIK